MSALEVVDFLSDFGQIMEAVMDRNPDMIVCVGDFNDKCMIWDGDHSGVIQILAAMFCPLVTCNNVPAFSFHKILINSQYNFQYT